MGWAVRLELHGRRFFCSNKEGESRIVTASLPSVVAPYARRTTRLRDGFTRMGFALGGEAGQRLVAGMGLTRSPAPLLRLLPAAQETAHSTPGVLGVHDFSCRRRICLGTILIALEKRIPVDLLPDREAEPVAKWVLAHPGGAIGSGDRGGASARGANLGAPNAKQGADRWHLTPEACPDQQTFFLRKQPHLKAATQIQQGPASSTQEAVSALPCSTGQSKRQAAEEPTLPSAACGTLSHHR